jgi:cytochrome c peroxidase
MTRSRGLLVVVSGAIISLVIAVGSTAAIDIEPTSATLTPEVLKQIAEVESEIDRIEAQTIDRLASPPDNQVQQIELLGKAMLYDKELSVNRNEACNFCHMPETGFTGPISELNRTTGSYPGSVRTRYSNRKTANPFICTAFPGSALQSRPGRLGRRKFLGYARNRAAARQPGGRAGGRTSDQSCRDGAA